MLTIWQQAQAAGRSVTAGQHAFIIIDGALEVTELQPGAHFANGNYFLSPAETEIAYLLAQIDGISKFVQHDGEWGITRVQLDGRTAWIPLADIGYDPVMNGIYRKSYHPEKEDSMSNMFADHGPHSSHLRRFERRQRLLDFIVQYKNENHGQSPTFRLMGAAAAYKPEGDRDHALISNSIITNDLAWLENGGFIVVHRPENIDRAVIIEVCGESYSASTASVYVKTEDGASALLAPGYEEEDNAID